MKLFSLTIFSTLAALTGAMATNPDTGLDGLQKRDCNGPIFEIGFHALGKMIVSGTLTQNTDSIDAGAVTPKLRSTVVSKYR
ncbi:hypothetical protein N7541_006130 [Penicillium brevicompactum]|uniref:Uncharacterized protein n=1 Tax=Penicillium brevicompactum TaxID=5074 RepID=A0A9W9R4J0_PENBR|nr:hypothetical protein N7541_006130 [Penicillium brevicompactum]